MVTPLHRSPAPTGSPEHGKAPAADPPRPKGVLLLNLGTPDSPDVPAVRRYLREFLADPEVIKLPRHMRWFNKPLAALIAQFRGPKSAHAYKSIWTDRGSPLKVITEDQVAALQKTLPSGWQVFYAMRYGNPSVARVLEEIEAAGVEQLVVIPMYPQYSGPTTGTAIADLYEQLRNHPGALHVTIRTVWYDDVNYIDAQAQRIADLAKQKNLEPSNCFLLYSAHSMPQSYVEAGDPYQEHALRTVELVTHRLGWPQDRCMVSYQSKLGPVPWLEPSTAATLERLAEAGEPNVLVVPLSFTADCLESLEEIGMGGKEEFEKHGGTLHLCPALNDFEPFIKTLFQLTVRGPRSWSEKDGERQPLLDFREPPAASDRDIDSLVMIGASIGGQLGDGQGPQLQHVTSDEFQCIKRPHEEVTALLEKLKAGGTLAECWLWNTCSRFELYGRLDCDPHGAQAEESIRRITADLLGEKAPERKVNILRGEAAWHHLLRTASGLNSCLPGDGEVASQLDAACRLAMRCGTAGPLLHLLREKLQHCQSELTTRTSWGHFRPEYCPIALKRLALRYGYDWSSARVLVIGGSVTSRSVLESLRSDFGVSDEQLTVAHRAQSKGRQIKRLDQALGQGERLIVDSYGDESLTQALTEADVVIFGIDARNAIVDAARLAGKRDFAARPMTILDFNTFGSTEGLAQMAGVTLHDARQLDEEVATFSREMAACPAFLGARDGAEKLIDTWLPTRAAQMNGDAARLKARLARQDAFGVCAHGCPLDKEPDICPRRLLKENVRS